MSQKEQITLDPEVQERLQRLRAQSIGYVNFIRWANRFPQNELKQHPNHRDVMLLSPQQCLRFAIAVQGEITYIGVQDVEAAWLQSIPFDTAYVSDRLYLVVNATRSSSLKASRLALGFLVMNPSLLDRIKATRFIQLVRIIPENGKVVSLMDDANDVLIPLRCQDIVSALLQMDKGAFGKDISRQIL